jgi:hypothetical protein
MIETETNLGANEIVRRELEITKDMSLKNPKLNSLSRQKFAGTIDG